MFIHTYDDTSFRHGWFVRAERETSSQLAVPVLLLLLLVVVIAVVLPTIIESIQ